MYIHGRLYHDSKQKAYHFRYLNTKNERISIDFRDLLAALNGLSERKWEIVGMDLINDVYLLHQPTEVTQAGGA